MDVWADQRMRVGRLKACLAGLLSPLLSGGLSEDSLELAKIAGSATFDIRKRLIR